MDERMQDFLEEIKPDYAHGNDADISPKAEEFYFQHWEVLSNKKEDFEWRRNKREYYSGDTILSVKTVLGENNFRLEAAMKTSVDNGLFTEVDANKLRDTAQKYRIMYHTLANFMPLWKNPRKSNLNLAKGNWFTYRDFPDLWLSNIKIWYMNPQDLNEKQYLKFEANAENYFDKFVLSQNDSMQNWKNYIDKNYLKAFVDDDYEVVSLFDGSHHPRSGILTASQIQQFLYNAIRIIECRAKELSEAEYGNHTTKE